MNHDEKGQHRTSKDRNDASSESTSGYAVLPLGSEGDVQFIQHESGPVMSQPEKGTDIRQGGNALSRYAPRP